MEELSEEHITINSIFKGFAADTLKRVFLKVKPGTYQRPPAGFFVRLVLSLSLYFEV